MTANLNIVYIIGSQSAFYEKKYANANFILFMKSA